MAGTAEKITGFSQKVLQQMCLNSWPGNIRELENMVQRSIITAKDNMIKEMVFPKITDLQQENSQEWQVKTLQQIEKEYILKVVENVMAGFQESRELQYCWDFHPQH